LVGSATTGTILSSFASGGDEHSCRRLQVFYEQAAQPAASTPAVQETTRTLPSTPLTAASLSVYGRCVREADGFRRGINFEASAHGVSFGRYVNSVGEVDITAMSALSFGHDNPISVADFRLGTGLPNRIRNFPRRDQRSHVQAAQY